MAKKTSTTAKQNEFKGVIEQDDKTNYWLKGGITPPGRLVWPSLKKPAITYQGRQKMQSGKILDDTDQEYRATLLFNKTDPILKDLEKKIEKVLTLSLGKMGAKKAHTPIKDGDELFKEDPKKNAHYKGTKFINLKRRADLEPPTVLDEVGEEMLAISDMYAGCWAIARVDFKVYTQQNGGVTAYWSSIKKIAEGDRLGFNQADKAKNDFEKDNTKYKIDGNKVNYG